MFSATCDWFCTDGSHFNYGVFIDNLFLIDLAKMAQIHTFCLVNSLLDSPMATWLTITGTLQVEVIDGDNSDAWIFEKPLDDWSENRINDEEDAPMLYYRLPYLTADTYYQLEVTAYNGIGWAQPHGEFIFKTAPGTLHDWGYDFKRSFALRFVHSRSSIFWLFSQTWNCRVDDFR